MIIFIGIQPPTVYFNADSEVASSSETEGGLKKGESAPKLIASSAIFCESVDTIVLFTDLDSKADQLYIE